jgi:hypothetical protein
MIEPRGKAIVGVARNDLKEFERSDAFGDGYKPMMEESRKGARGTWGWVTYGTAFRLAFFVHFVFGLVIAFLPHLIVPEPSPGNPPAPLVKAK